MGRRFFSLSQLFDELKRRRLDTFEIAEQKAPGTGNPESNTSEPNTPEPDTPVPDTPEPNTEERFRVLKTLDGAAGGMSWGALSEQTNLAVDSCMKTIRRLKTEGLVDIETDARGMDRIRLTEAGKALR